MIKYHPTPQMLTSFAAGELPASLSIAVSIHSSMCSDCQENIDAETARLAEKEFTAATIGSDGAFEGEQNTLVVDAYEFAEEQMAEIIANITADNDITEQNVNKQSSIKIGNETVVLPQPLANVSMGNWNSLGKLSRSTLNLNEDHIHSHLLNIEPGGEVPAHTHKGFEVTLLLKGSFKDEMGEYNKGDFILLDGAHNHTPYTESGCLCFTIADDALQFTQGIHKLFNPIGNYIY
ncbi:MAG: ChrR family anti-sigma-E factor [Kangiellaceae bacterium]|jgi:putative transcriptional regulator|nr:ChrR family anti-sigma-E factor [Kangiellaceae bacterium]